MQGNQGNIVLHRFYRSTKKKITFQKESIENALIRNNAHYFVILFNMYSCNTKFNNQKIASKKLRAK